MPTFKEMMKIAEALDVAYEQTFVLTDEEIELVLGIYEKVVIFQKSICVQHAIYLH